MTDAYGKYTISFIDLYLTIMG